MKRREVNNTEAIKPEAHSTLVPKIAQTMGELINAQKLTMCFKILVGQIEAVAERFVVGIIVIALSRDRMFKTPETAVTLFLNLRLFAQR